MNILSLLKASREALPKNMLPALMESFGVKGQLEELTADELASAFQEAAQATQRPGAEVVRLRAAMPDGSDVHVLMILSPRRSIESRTPKKALTTLEPAML